MRVLIVSYVFPPYGGAGVQRVSKLVEFLVARGHYVSVVSHLSGAILDSGLSIKELKNVEVLRIDFSKYCSNESCSISIELREFIVKNDPKLVFSTSPTFEAHILAQKLKDTYQAHWIADFRDIESEYLSWFNIITKRQIRRLEAQIVSACDGIIVISEYHKSYLVRLYKVLGEKVTVVMNGYDEADFAKAVAGVQKTNSEFRADLELVHVGTFYGKRTPLFLLVNSIVAQRKLGVNLNLRFVGKNGALASLMFRFFQRYLSIELVPPVPHSQAVQYMSQADLLVLVPGRFGVGVITGKVFEYVASGRTVINLYSYKGPLTDILSREEGVFNIHEFNYLGFCRVISLCCHADTDANYDRTNWQKYQRNNQYMILENKMREIGSELK